MEHAEKMALLKNLSYEDHPVFDLVDNWTISRIVHQLSSIEVKSTSDTKAVLAILDKVCENL